MKARLLWSARTPIIILIKRPGSLCEPPPPPVARSRFISIIRGGGGVPTVETNTRAAVGDRHMRGRSGRCCVGILATVRGGRGPGTAVGAAVASLPTVACLKGSFF